MKIYEQNKLIKINSKDIIYNPSNIEYKKKNEFE